MFVYPIFWGCKYTNKIRIINNNPVFQRIILLITLRSPCWYTPGHDAKFSADFPASQHDKAEELANRNTEKRSYGHQKKDNLQTFRLLRKVSVYLGDVRNEGTGR